MCKMSCSSSAGGVLRISVTVKKEMHALLNKIQFLSLLVFCIFSSETNNKHGRKQVQVGKHRLQI